MRALVDGTSTSLSKGVDTSDVFFDEKTVWNRLSLLGLRLLELGVIFDDLVGLVVCLSLAVDNLGERRI